MAPELSLLRCTTRNDTMLASQLLLVSAMVTSTPQPLVVDFPSPTNCLTCPESSEAMFSTGPSMWCPSPDSSAMVTSSPVLTFPLPGFSCQPDNDCIRKRCLATKHHSTRDMYPTADLMRSSCHGSYYFRPYNVCTIPLQQAIAQGWGDDPRMPYASKLFESIYRQTDLQLGTGHYDQRSAVVLPVSSTSTSQMPILVQQRQQISQADEPQTARASDHFSPVH
jgi:hypothetical protein